MNKVLLVVVTAFVGLVLSGCGTSVDVPPATPPTSGSTAPKIEIFAPSSASVAKPGDTITLSWKVQGEALVSLNGKQVKSIGSETVTVSAATTFVLLAQNKVGMDQASVGITVGTPNPDPNPNPTGKPCKVGLTSFFVDKTTINVGETATLTWVSDCDNITINRATKPGTGSEQVSPIVTTPYTAIAPVVVGSSSMFLQITIATPANLPDLQQGNYTELKGWYLDKNQSMDMNALTGFIVVGKMFSVEAVEYYSSAAFANIRVSSQVRTRKITCLSPAPISIAKGNAISASGSSKCLVLVLPTATPSLPYFNMVAPGQTGGQACGGNVVVVITQANSAWNMTAQPYSTSVFYRMLGVDNTKAPWLTSKTTDASPLAWQLTTSFGFALPSTNPATGVWMQWENSCNPVATYN